MLQTTNGYTWRFGFLLNSLRVILLDLINPLSFLMLIIDLLISVRRPLGVPFTPPHQVGLEDLGCLGIDFNQLLPIDMEITNFTPLKRSHIKLPSLGHSEEPGI